MNSPDSTCKILSIDIGGSRIKATILDVDGVMIQEYVKITTPATGQPKEIIEAIQTLIKDFEPYDKVSVGFPGYIKNGVVFTAPNLGTEKWKDVPLGKLLSETLGKPVRLVNDADLQGLGIVQGKGLEITVTLGTGFGTAFLINGNLLPHFEIAHHPVSKDRTYDEYIGEKALEEVGEERWNKRIRKVITILKTVFNYDHLYVSGGNAKRITFKLDDNITIVTNKDGIKGGARLWQNSDDYCVQSFHPLEVK